MKVAPYRGSIVGRILSIVCLPFVVSLIFACTKEPQTYSPASDFSLQTLDGREITLQDMRGKVVLLDFWATWCKPCQEAIPHLAQLQRTYGEKGFEVIGLSLDKGNPETVLHFVRSMDIPYPVAIAPEELARRYRINGLPTTFLIDQEGKIRKKTMGFNKAIAQQLANQVAELVAAEP